MSRKLTSSFVGVAVGAAFALTVTIGYCERLAARVAQASSQAATAPAQAEIAQLETVSRAFRSAAKLAQPAVAHIMVQGGEMTDEEFDEYYESRRHKLPEDMSKDQARIYHKRLPPGAGSGVIIDDEGYVLTNNHVVDGRENITVRLADQREYAATLVGVDSKADLAVIKIEARDLHALPFADSDAVEVGSWVLALGAPFGLQQTVTHGIVSAKGRSGIGLDVQYQDFIQTDAAINPGNSGGPLISLRGEIVGINTAIASDGSASNAGVGFAIPSNFARKIAGQLIEFGEAPRGWLGVGLSDITEDDVDIFGLPEKAGVMVESALADTPAAEAGLQTEDVIISVNGQLVENEKHFCYLIADFAPDDTVELHVVRNRKVERLRVVLAKQPDRLPRAQSHSFKVPEIGAYVRTMRPPLGERFFFDASARGVLVVGVMKDTKIPEGALDDGDLIVACNGKPVANYKDLRDALDAAKYEKTLELRLLDPDGDEAQVYINR